MSRRRRLDIELVRRSLADSESHAQALVDAGKVLVGGALVDNVARQVAAGEAIALVADEPRFVSRGGEKLAAALTRFGVRVAGRRVVDAGSSTGGFTDCVLQAGAARVIAIDVGRNQLHERIRQNSRVDVHEQTSVRGLDAASVGGPGSLLVGDLSFISLRTVIDSLLALTEDDGELVLLVKPQFEANKQEADRAGGVIRDPGIWKRTLSEVCTALADRGAGIMGVMVSPLTGADGNVEFLLHARRHSGEGSRWATLVSAALGEVEADR